jgi:LPXTG-motif cell wall-anchored protein
MRNLFTFASAALGAALLIAGGVVAPANATPTDEPGRVVGTPAEVSPAAAIVDGGLQQVRLYSGSLNWSVDGLGINNYGASGDLQVEKPAGASVKAAFLMTAASSTHPMPTDITLATQPVTFSIHAARGYYTNFFADVTTIVKPIVDAGSGTLNITVNEGTFRNLIDGTSLVVVFDDPSVPLASVAIYFGTSDPAGDTFTMEFNALTLPQTEDLRMSVGSSFSYGAGQNSSVLVNGEVLSNYAGHFDDCDQFVSGDEVTSNWTCNALLTVGGVGDSLTNPTLAAPWSTTADDELYSLSPFVAVGDSEIVVETSNPSADDNIFMTVFYLDKVAVFDPELSGGGSLAETGSAETGWMFGVGGVLLAVGMLLAVITRRRARRIS